MPGLPRKAGKDRSNQANWCSKKPAPRSRQGEWIRCQKINMQSSLAQYNIVNKVRISIPPNLNQKNLSKDGIVERWRFDDPEAASRRYDMSLSRRHFVQLGSLSLLAGAVLPAAFAQDGTDDETFSPERVAALDGISRQDFEPYLGERFAVSLAGRSLGKMTLIEVRELTVSTAKGKNAAATQALTGFALRFQGSGGTLPQGTYTFSQSYLGEFPLFIVPAGPDVQPRTYTAIFNKRATPGT